jgi:hypothetical protein
MRYPGRLAACRGFFLLGIGLLFPLFCGDLPDVDHGLFSISMRLEDIQESLLGIETGRTQMIFLLVGCDVEEILVDLQHSIGLQVTASTRQIKKIFFISSP